MGALYDVSYISIKAFLSLKKKKKEEEGNVTNFNELFFKITLVN